MTESCVEDFASITKGSTQKLYSGGIRAGSASLILGQSIALKLTLCFLHFAGILICCQMGFAVG